MNSFRNKAANPSKGFSLTEVLIVVAILGVVAAVGFQGFRGANEGARLTKLKSDVATVNQAIKIYLANGGSLDAFATSAISTEAEAELVGKEDSVVSAMMASYSTGEQLAASDPGGAAQQLLNKLKTRRSASADATFAGFGGSMLDQRLAARIQSSGEAATGKPRAVWNPNKMSFEIVDSGLPGIREFYLDSALSAVDFGEESRDGSAIDFNTGDGWIWSYTDAPDTGGPPGPTLIPISAPSPAGAGSASPDSFSVAEDAFASTSSGSAPNLISNDTVPSGGLFVQNYTQPANGSVVVTPDGKITSFLADPNFLAPIRSPTRSPTAAETPRRRQ